jgi:hypothetical protein
MLCFRLFNFRVPLITKSVTFLLRHPVFNQNDSMFETIRNPVRRDIVLNQIGKFSDICEIKVVIQRSFKSKYNLRV